METESKPLILLCGRTKGCFLYQTDVWYLRLTASAQGNQDVRDQAATANNQEH